MTYRLVEQQKVLIICTSVGLQFGSDLECRRDSFANWLLKKIKKGSETGNRIGSIGTGGEGPRESVIDRLA